MKKTILSLMLLAMVCPLAAQISPTVSVQGTNATLRWTSTPGERYFVHYRRAFHPDPGLQWKLIGTNLLATGTETTFQHTGGVPRVPAGVGGGGGGGGSSPPVLLSATSPTTDPTQDKDDKVKAKDNALPAFPTLPDEKALEKWLKELLKEYERQQREGGGVPAITALMVSTLTAEQATNNSMGYYAVSRASDDTDGDGLPDWWEATYGLQLLVNDAAADPDGDQASNLAEYTYGTNPTNSASKPMPTVAFTSPVNTSTYLPVVQITGSINLNLRTLSYSVTNAAGVLTDVAGFATSRTVTPGPGFTNSPSTHSAGFQCFDVPLTNGVNTVGLRFTDAYGLTHLTNVTFTVNFAASPAAPQASLLWPGPGAVIAADTFTLRGRLDNPTAQVVARITLGGIEQEFGGVVERDGTFWLEDLPTPPSGTVRLVATDAGGKASTNTFSVSRSAVTLSLNPPAGPDLWNSTMNLSGTVSHTNYILYVNSRRASVNASGGWIATNVPVNAGGVATFAFRGGEIANIVPLGLPTSMAGNGGLGGLYQLPTGNPGGFGDGSSVDAIFDFDKPPRIVVASYKMRMQDDNPTLTTGHTNRITFDWMRSGAGYSGLYTSYWLSERYAHPIWWQTGAVTYPFPGTSGTEVASGFFSSGAPIAYTNLVGPPPVPWGTGSVYQRVDDRNYSYRGETLLELQTGGRGLASSGSLYEFIASAMAYNAEGASANLASESLRVMEQALDAAGYTYRTNLPANATLSLTFAAANAAGQVPPTSRPSQGAHSAFTISNGDVQLHMTGQPYYLRPPASGVGAPVQTNAGPLYLGYGRFRLPYKLTFRTQPSGLKESITGAEPLRIEWEDANPPAGNELFDWDGVVPPLYVNGVLTNQRLNTRQFVNPSLTTLRFQAGAWVNYRRNLIARLVQPTPFIRVEARAVAIGAATGSATNIAAVSTSLQTMSYTPSSLSNPSVTDAASAARLGLVWYSISHGTTNAFGQFVGLSFAQTFFPTNLPSGLNYSLAFLNGCASASQTNTGAATAVFRSRFGPNCVLVGWKESITHGHAMRFAAEFFNHLASGMAVGAAKDRALETSGLFGAQSGSGSMLTVNDNITILPTDISSMMVDLRN